MSKMQSKMQSKIKILSVFGTRPEATKMAPLVKVLEGDARVESIVCVTAQHRQMLDQVLDLFAIKPQFDLNIMLQNQDLAHITTAALNGLMGVMRETSPDLLLVHGDTTTTMAAGLAAFYSGIRVGHVEAGLRSFDMQKPFPEEANRRIVSVLASLNFAPTQQAAANLLAERVGGHDNPDNIYVTGNTAIDAIDSLVSPEHTFNEEMLNKLDWSNRRFITVTAHRRENYGQPMVNVCNAIKQLAADFDDVEFVWPVHLSPAVRNIVFDILGNNSKIHLLDPTDVADVLNVMARSYMVMSDSGGIQEEAPHLNKPVLVLREVTERPEGLAAGCLRLAGTKLADIYSHAAELLTNAEAHAQMAAAPNPFGDGKASQRILQGILHHFGMAERPPAFGE